MHIELFDLVLLFCIASSVGLWWQGKAVKELALPLVKRQCKKMNLQLLDETISIHKTKLTWYRGQPQLKRIFHFEFTSTGTARYIGTASFIGKKLENIDFEVHHI